MQKQKATQTEIESFINSNAHYLALNVETALKNIHDKILIGIDLSETEKAKILKALRNRAINEIRQIKISY